VLDIFKQSTGTAADYQRRLVLFKLLGNDLFAVFKVVGIDHPDAFYSHGLCKSFKVYRNGGIALNGFAGGGILLVSGHARYAVVENYDGGNALVVCDVYKTGNARMNKGGIADDRHRFFGGFVVVCFIEAVEGGNACAHANAGVDLGKGSECTEGVASDVSADIYVKLFESVVKTSVGAAGTKHRRTDGNVGLKRNALGLLAEYRFLNNALRIFSAQ